MTVRTSIPPTTWRRVGVNVDLFDSANHTLAAALESNHGTNIAAVFETLPQARLTVGAIAERADTGPATGAAFSDFPPRRE